METFPNRAPEDFPATEKLALPFWIATVPKDAADDLPTTENEAAPGAMPVVPKEGDAPRAVMLTV